MKKVTLAALAMAAAPALTLAEVPVVLTEAPTFNTITRLHDIVDDYAGPSPAANAACVTEVIEGIEGATVNDELSDQYLVVANGLDFSVIVDLNHDDSGTHVGWVSVNGSNSSSHVNFEEFNGAFIEASSPERNIDLDQTPAVVFLKNLEQHCL